VNKQAFLNEIEEIFELDKNVLTGSETLEELGEWDSLAVMGFIAMVDENFEVILEAERIMSSVTVDDLIALVSVYLEKEQTAP